MVVTEEEYKFATQKERDEAAPFIKRIEGTDGGGWDWDDEANAFIRDPSPDEQNREAIRTDAIKNFWDSTDARMLPPQERAGLDYQAKRAATCGH